MPKQIKQGELQEFWEWCGLKRFCSPEDDMYHRGIWEDKDGLRIDTPPLDLNNLFKYAVPSKEVPSFRLSYEYYLSSYRYRARVCVKSGICREAEHETDPAQALYQAIQKARRKDK